MKPQPPVFACLEEKFQHHYRYQTALQEKLPENEDPRSIPCPYLITPVFQKALSMTGAETLFSIPVILNARFVSWKGFFL